MKEPVHGLLRDALERLRIYMGELYPGRTFEREFWEYENDDLFIEALGYLPLHLPEEILEDLDMLDDAPRGYRLAVPIFWIEDDYHVNGWTALSNAGEWLLPRAISAYREIGLPTEAAALDAALTIIRSGRNDYQDEATEAAYKSVDNPFADDDLRHDALLRYFRGDVGLFAFDKA